LGIFNKGFSTACSLLRSPPTDARNAARPPLALSAQIGGDHEEIGHTQENAKGQRQNRAAAKKTAGA